MSWLGSLFSREPKQPEFRFIEVGRADISIVEIDGTKHEIHFIGEYNGEHPFGGDWVFDAEFYFEAWREKAGRTGMASEGGNKFVPLCNIKSIDVDYKNHVLEIEK